MDTTPEIINELYESVRLLGGKGDILQIIGSWRDTRNDDEVLDMLRQWNRHAQAGEIDYLPKR